MSTNAQMRVRRDTRRIVINSLASHGFAPYDQSFNLRTSAIPKRYFEIVYRNGYFKHHWTLLKGITPEDEGMHLRQFSEKLGGYVLLNRKTGIMELWETIHGSPVTFRKIRDFIPPITLKD